MISIIFRGINVSLRKYKQKMNNNLSVNVTLSELNGVIITNDEVGGVEEKGIFIPLRFNTIYRNRKGEYILTLKAVEKKPNQYGYVYGLLPKASKKKNKELEMLGQSTNTWCGNIIRSTEYTKVKKNRVSIDDCLLYTSPSPRDRG